MTTRASAAWRLLAQSGVVLLLLGAVTPAGAVDVSNPASVGDDPCLQQTHQRVLDSQLGIIIERDRRRLHRRPRQPDECDGAADEAGEGAALAAPAPPPPKPASGRRPAPPALHPVPAGV